MKVSSMQHEVVELAPKVLQPAVLYVSPKYQSAVHLCCCGCGEKVVTPLSPAEWQVHLDPAGVSLSPSIGNWAMNCRSHYWIRNGRVHWAGAISKRQIQAVHRRDKADLEVQIRKQAGSGAAPYKLRPRWLLLLVNWLLGK